MQDALSGKQPNVRLQMIHEALAIWRLQPVIGRGAGQYAVVGSFQAYSHNNYTELLVNFGVLGFVLYYGLHLLVLVSAIRGILRGSAPHRSAFVLVVMILALDMAMVTYFAKISWLFLVFAADLVTARSASRVPSTLRVPGGWGMRRSWAGLSSPHWQESRLHPR
jgi:O-antigen ligase